MRRRSFLLPVILLTGCSIEDSHIAHVGEQQFIGMSEVDPELKRPG